MIYTHPTGPGFESIEWIMSTATRSTKSPTSRVQQIDIVGGQELSVMVTLPHMLPATAKEWLAFFAKLNGRQHDFYLSDTIGVESRWASGTLDNTGRTVLSVDTGADSISTSGAHNLIDGVRVRVSSTATVPPPLVVGTNYYVIYVDSDTFKLEESIGGGAINLTGAGTGTRTVTPYNVGPTIYAKDLDLSVTNYYEGDKISISDRIRIVSADATANAAGRAIVDIWPSTVLDHGAADIDAGNAAQGVFKMDEATSAQRWNIHRLSDKINFKATQLIK